MMNISKARYNMIEQQIKPWNIFDTRVLNAISRLPRENFVPKAFKHMALMDVNIPLPSGSLTFTPKEEAKIAQSLELKQEDKVLQIGVGCGYLTSLLASLSKEVVGVEVSEANYQLAVENLSSLDNVKVQNQCGLSMNSSDTFDVIVCTASAQQCPPSLLRPLNNGGRLFFIEGADPIMQAVVLKKEKGVHSTRQVIFETNCDRLINLVEGNAFSL